MSNAIEIEAKVLVNADDYRKLVKLFPDASRYMQTNYYIDSKDRMLAKSGIALRIREKNGQYEMTLKTPLSQGLLEKNVPLSMNEFCAFRDFGEFPKCDLLRFLTMLDFDVTDLKILTSLATERIDVEYEGGLLSIDRNSYSGKVDYEIEFEYNNMEDAEAILGDFLKKNDVPVVFSKMRKTARAMAALNEK
ncbi:MAG: CYTH domain-containing protein [Bacilli bacterium]|nr:CYTH domain-containing protein [Bacilli bacterium]